MTKWIYPSWLALSSIFSSISSKFSNSWRSYSFLISSFWSNWINFSSVLLYNFCSSVLSFLLFCFIFSWSFSMSECLSFPIMLLFTSFDFCWFYWIFWIVSMIFMVLWMDWCNFFNWLMVVGLIINPSVLDNFCSSLTWYCLYLCIFWSWSFIVDYLSFLIMFDFLSIFCWFFSWFLIFSTLSSLFKFDEPLYHNHMNISFVISTIFISSLS